MTYDARPVFDFRVNVAAEPKEPVTYDVRALSNDWGPIASAMLQRHVLVAWEGVEVDLNSPVEVNAFESFTAEAKGRLNGFWFPTPRRFAVAAAGTYSGGETNDIFIADQDLAETWETDWGQLHLWLVPPDGSTPIPCRVVEVAAASGGLERVTLSIAQPAGYGPTWSIHRLAYARFASDDEEATILDVGRQNRRINIVELPQGYADYETGELKVYFYRFFLAGPTTAASANDWFFTSFQAPLSSTYGGAVAATAHESIVINHGAIRRSIRSLDNNSVSIETVREAAYPWARMIPTSIGLPLFVQIREASLATPNTTRLLFTGRVKSAKPKGKAVTLTCVNVLSFANVRVPGLFMGASCNYDVFDERTCKLPLLGHEVTATVSAISGSTVTLSASGFSGKPLNWYAAGLLEIGTYRTYDAATIQRSNAAVGTTVEVLLGRSVMGLTVGATVKVRPGCIGTKDRCIELSNYPNFGGNPHVPENNPSAPASTAGVNGNKK